MRFRYAGVANAASRRQLSELGAPTTLLALRGNRGAFCKEQRAPQPCYTW